MTENQIDITNQDGLSTELGAPTDKKIGLFNRQFVAFKARCRSKVGEMEDNE